MAPGQTVGIGYSRQSVCEGSWKTPASLDFAGGICYTHETKVIISKHKAEVASLPLPSSVKCPLVRINPKLPVLVRPWKK
jgi:hypothetical protein